MHDEPRPASESGDSGDLTQRHPVVPGQSNPAAPLSPAGSTSGTPVSPWAAPTQAGSSWAQPGTPPVDRFTPAPEPRADWARSLDQAPPVTPERWYEPAPTPAPTTTPTTTRTHGRGGSVLL